MEINTRIGDYEILEELGRGGMGRVYRVRNVISDRVEAMKVLLPDLVSQPELESRFLREIKVLAALEHPNIATLRTAMKDGNQVVMIMEFVDGETLSQRIKRGPLPLDEALRHIDQVLEALAYAHARGVIHRDIKPANMMLTSEGLVKLTDFGIARSQNDATLTAAGTTTGSLFYMSPEQVNAEPTDARSDLYSVGISLYEMVTGQRPFQADSDFAVMVAHLKEMPRQPIELAPQLGSELNALIMKAIAKSPADRYQSADEFRAALATVPQFPTAVGPSPVAVPPPNLAEAAKAAADEVTRRRTPTVTPISPATVMPISSERVRALMDAPKPSPATVPPVPQMPPGPPVPQPVMRKPANAVLYMVIGGVFAIGALAATALYFNSTRSASAGPTPPSSAVPASTPAPAASAAPSAGPSAAATSPSPTAATAAGAGTPSGAPPAAAAAASPAPTAPATETPAPAASATAPAAAPSASTAAPSASPVPTSAAASARSAETNAPPTAPSTGRPLVRQGAAQAGPGRLPPAARRAAARALARENAASDAPASASPSAAASSQPIEPAVDFDELEAELDQLTARVVAINTSLDNLRREQSRQGLGLRADMTARQQTMNANITRAEEALKQRNAVRAQRFKAAAEADVEALERFLGR